MEFILFNNVFENLSIMFYWIKISPYVLQPQWSSSKSPCQRFIMGLTAQCALLRCIKAYDKNLSQERTLQLEIEADETFLLPTVSILAVGLEYIWEQRKLKKTTSTYSIRAELEAAVSLRRRSRSKKIREAGSVMENMINNFLV